MQERGSAVGISWEGDRDGRLQFLSWPAEQSGR